MQSTNKDSNMSLAEQLIDQVVNEARGERPTHKLGELAKKLGGKVTTMTPGDFVAAEFKDKDSATKFMNAAKKMSKFVELMSSAGGKFTVEVEF